MDYQRLANDTANLHARIERRIGILKNRLNVASKTLIGVVLRYPDIGAIKDNLPCGWAQELEYCACDSCLSAPGFSDQAKYLTGADEKRDPIDCPNLTHRPLQNRSARHRKLNGQVPDLEQQVHRLSARLQALEAGDPDQARAIVERMLGYSEERILSEADRLEEAGLLGPEVGG